MDTCAQAHPGEACVYYIVIYAWSACEIDVTATFAAAESNGAVVLSDTLPVRATVPIRGYLFYEYELTSLTEPIRVSVTTLSGDCDLFGSFAQSRPKANTAQYSSQAMGAAPDSLTLSPESHDWPTRRRILLLAWRERVSASHESTWRVSGASVAAEGIDASSTPVA